MRPSTLPLHRHYIVNYLTVYIHIGFLLGECQDVGSADDVSLICGQLLMWTASCNHTGPLLCSERMFAEKNRQNALAGFALLSQSDLNL